MQSRRRYRRPAAARLPVGPLDDRLAETPHGEHAADRELVDVRRIRGLLAPEERVVPEKRHRRGGLAVHLHDVQLTALDPLRELVLRKGQRPLVIAERGHVYGRLVEDRAGRLDVGVRGSAHVHSTSMASPNE